MAEIVYNGSKGSKDIVKNSLRPASAPIQSNGIQNNINRKRTDLVYGYSGHAFQIKPPTPKDDDYRIQAQARVNEKRVIKESPFWGRSVPEKRDLPAFWSVGTHGQPFNDKRLWNGESIYYNMVHTPQTVQVETRNPNGPLMERDYCIRKSITSGQKLVNLDLSPKLYPIEDSDGQPNDKRAILTLPERFYLLSKLQPQQRILAYSLNLDRDTQHIDFVPWTQRILDSLDKDAWKKDKHQCIRLATEQLEVMMFRHLLYLSNVEYNLAQAPYQRQKDVLIRAFWAVDPEKTGYVSLEQFMQVWQNILQLWDYDLVEKKLGPYSELNSKFRPKKKKILVPKYVLESDKNGNKVRKYVGRRILDIHMAASIFQKYGYNRSGNMPYVVFVNAITESPNRLLGHELILNLKNSDQNGFNSPFDIAYALQNAKIIYPKCKTGVFAPSGFDARQAYRSNFLPKAHMWLEHVHGYAGVDNLSPNLFYTAGCDTTPNQEFTEMVYYVGAVGIVFVKEKNMNDEKPQSQRFFFGHDNDIECLAIHPSRKFVATGQQTSFLGVPYVCIWDTKNCNQLQKLDHEKDDRAVIACCFSGHIDCKDKKKMGGDILVTVTSDDRHTIRLWRWMTSKDKYIKQQYIPGWFYGPQRKLRDLQSQNLFYNPGSHRYRQRKQEDYTFSMYRQEDDSIKPHYLTNQYRFWPVDPDDARGFHTMHPPMQEDGTWEILSNSSGPSLQLCKYNGCQGTPPCVYGVAWNPYRPQDGRRGSEFLSYGVKHLKTWMASDQNVFVATQAHFGVRNIENVQCACYIPAQHHRHAPGDTCIASGFANGDVGIWVPPYPTIAGSAYKLQRVFNASQPGRTIQLNDGTQKPTGVRCVKLCEDQRFPRRKDNENLLLTAGSQGEVKFWRLSPPQEKGLKSDGTRRLGYSDFDQDQAFKSYILRIHKSPLTKEVLPTVKSIDVHPDYLYKFLGNQNDPESDLSFIAGTDTCCIWEKKGLQSNVLSDGHQDDVYSVDPHPEDENRYVTVCKSRDIKEWNAATMKLVKAASVGFEASCCAYSKEPFDSKSVLGWQPYDEDLDNTFRRQNDTKITKDRVTVGYHIAVGGFKGKVLIVDAGNLQPLVKFQHSSLQISCLAYSNQTQSEDGVQSMLLAIGSHDLNIYIHNATYNYQFLSKMVGHSGVILSLDWSCVLNSPMEYSGKTILQSNSAAYEILYWEPYTGRKVIANQRNTNWASWTCTLGFSVMGIWEQYMDNTDINSVHRSHRGKPPDFIGIKSGMEGLSVTLQASEEQSSDLVPGCGYLVTADDEQFVKLFNYPVLSDEAPYRCYRGHASHVMCVRFLSDDRRVVSVGGKDRAVFQWRTCRVNYDDEGIDESLLNDMDKAIRQKAQVLDSLAPQPNGKWGKLDEEGKWFGPQLDDEYKTMARDSMAKTTRINPQLFDEKVDTVKVSKKTLLNSLVSRKLLKEKTLKGRTMHFHKLINGLSNFQDQDEEQDSNQQSGSTPSQIQENEISDDMQQDEETDKRKIKVFDSIKKVGSDQIRAVTQAHIASQKFKASVKKASLSTKELQENLVAQSLTKDAVFTNTIYNTQSNQGQSPKSTLQVKNTVTQSIIQNPENIQSYQKKDSQDEIDVRNLLDTQRQNKYSITVARNSQDLRDSEPEQIQQKQYQANLDSIKEDTMKKEVKIQENLNVVNQVQRKVTQDDIIIDNARQIVLRNTTPIDIPAFDKNQQGILHEVGFKEDKRDSLDDQSNTKDQQQAPKNLLQEMDTYDFWKSGIDKPMLVGSPPQINYSNENVQRESFIKVNEDLKVVSALNNILEIPKYQQFKQPQLDIKFSEPEVQNQQQQQLQSPQIVKVEQPQQKADKKERKLSFDIFHRHQKPQPEKDPKVSSEKDKIVQSEKDQKISDEKQKLQVPVAELNQHNLEKLQKDQNHEKKPNIMDNIKSALHIGSHKSKSDKAKSEATNMSEITQQTKTDNYDDDHFEKVSQSQASATEVSGKSKKSLFGKLFGKEDKKNKSTEAQKEVDKQEKSGKNAQKDPKRDIKELIKKQNISSAALNIASAVSVQNTETNVDLEESDLDSEVHG